MNPQATAQVRGGGSDGKIRIPPVLPRLVLRQSLSRRDRRRRPESTAALVVSHTLNPAAVPTYMFRRTAANLAVVPCHPN